ncbi:PQQ-binding-like beta-propeller repeat protein [Kitasatospora sp. NPDC088548]|uniref:outer membrane protein assembly factor BamB family protein n=1 Tax=Kitasatospora sp. NPDC088548 TaxID=3364075 RepID=UPI00380113EA
MADQRTHVDGAPVPGRVAPAAPGTPPPPGPPPAPAPAPGSEYAYAPTAAAFPAQSAPPPPPGAPVGPYDPAPPYQAPVAGQPYGYPAPPPANGYGYPQQAGYGYQGVPVPPAPKQRNPVMLWGGIIGGVLAIAIVAGLVVLLTDDPKHDPVASTGGTVTGGSVTGGTTDDPTTSNSPSASASGGTGGGKAGAYNLAWNAAKPANAGSGSQVLGAWGTDKVLVRADTTGIRAVNASDGKEAWTIAPPAGAKEFCTVSHGVNSKHVVAVSLNTGDSDCSTVGTVDLTSGKLLWSTKVTTDRLSGPTLSITDKTVVIAGTAIGAVSITDGSPVWQYQPREKNCSVYSRAAGNQIAISDRCYQGSNTTAQLQIVDAETGKATSGALPLDDLEHVDKALSSSPLVLLITNNTSGDYVLPFDKSNKPMAKLPVKEAGSDSLRLSGEHEAFTQNVISGTTLYAQVNGTKPAINAYDLTTGKRLWSSTGGTNQGIRLVSGTDKDGRVRAVLDMGYNKDAKLVTLAPTDGSVSELGDLAAPKGTYTISSSTEYVIQPDGSLVGFARSGGSDAPVFKYAKK